MPNFRKFLEHHNALDSFIEDFGKGRSLSKSAADTFIDREYSSKHDPIDKAFVWRHTSKGVKYWQDLRHKYFEYWRNDKSKQSRIN